MGKKLTYAQAKKKLDKVFSEWVRRFHADEDGYATCVSCKVRKPWQELQAGHFISRVRMGGGLRWDEKNVAPQCFRCNVLLRGNPGGYALYLNETYGPDIFRILDSMARLDTKFSRCDLEDMIEDYEGRLGRMR